MVIAVDSRDIGRHCRHLAAVLTISPLASRLSTIVSRRRHADGAEIGPRIGEHCLTHIARSAGARLDARRGSTFPDGHSTLSGSLTGLWPFREMATIVVYYSESPDGRLSYFGMRPGRRVDIIVGQEYRAAQASMLRIAF